MKSGIGSAGYNSQDGGPARGDRGGCTPRSHQPLSPPFRSRSTSRSAPLPEPRVCTGELGEERSRNHTGTTHHVTFVWCLSGF